MSITITSHAASVVPGTNHNDLTGRRFGKLYAVGPTVMRARSNVVWECLCYCGQTTFQRSGHLVNGDVRSCGCSKRGRPRGGTDDRAPPDLRYRARTAAADYASRRPWSEQDIASVHAWRGEHPPVPFNIIAQRLGRTKESIRIKLFDMRKEAARGGNRPIGFPKEQRDAIPAAPDVDNPCLMLCDLLMRSGGMTERRIVRKPFVGGTKVISWEDFAPNGSRRPRGWRDGMLINDMSPAHLDHLDALQSWWAKQRIFLHPPMQGED